MRKGFAQLLLLIPIFVLLAATAVFFYFNHSNSTKTQTSDIALASPSVATATPINNSTPKPSKPTPPASTTKSESGTLNDVLVTVEDNGKSINLNKSQKLNVFQKTVDNGIEYRPAEVGCCNTGIDASSSNKNVLRLSGEFGEPGDTIKCGGDTACVLDTLTYEAIESGTSIITLGCVKNKMPCPDFKLYVKVN